MTNSVAWINRRIWLGWILLAVGLLVGVIGILLPRLVGSLPFNARIITGIGILLVGVGCAELVRYGAIRKDTQAARRLISEERDERLQFIKARAGGRAYWLSAALVYIGLLWVSFAENGSLPTLSADGLWYFLAGAFILPLIVYIISLMYDQAHL